MDRPSLARAAAGLLAATVLVSGTLHARGGEPLTDAEFERLHGELARMATEKVWSIDWHISLREAREQAARENKPILLWCTNNGGTNPLGPC